MILAECGASAPAATGTKNAESPSGNPLDGTWRLEAAGEPSDAVLDLHGADLRLVRGCLQLSSSWSGRDGLFLADAGPGAFARGGCFEPTSQPEVPWLATTVNYSRVDDGWQLRDRTGQVVASLHPGGRLPEADGAQLTFGPSDEASRIDRAALNEATAAPLPANLRPAHELDVVGRWAVPGTGPHDCGTDVLEFGPEGSWGGQYDGHPGRWVVGAGGLALATEANVDADCDDDRIAPPVVDVDRWMSRLTRLGLDGDQLVLLDADGKELGRLDPKR
jgi:hypothetical protein